MKILISAYACEPNRGSEPGVGWHTVWELAKDHQVWVLTRPDDGRPAIEKYLRDNPNPNLNFVYFNLPILGSFWQWGSIAFVLHYYLWQIQAYFVARLLHQKIDFDVAHHVTFVRYSTPSFIALLPIPFVWGPVGGGETAPQPFWQDFSTKAKIYELLRLAAHRVGELDPFVHLTAKRSRVVKATTKDTAARIALLGANKIEIASESSLSRAEITLLEQLPLPESQAIRFISMGRLIHWKGFHLALKAFAQAKLDYAEYWLLGEGVESQKLQQLAAELGIAHQVKFFGRLPRQETLATLGQTHILVHPSLHDSGGWVCLEAMAAGRPVICLDLGGPGVQVTAETGIKVPAHYPEQVVEDLSEAMRRLASDSTLRLKLGHKGQKTVKEIYNWHAKVQKTEQLYGQIAQ
ncbi:MAG: glycosyltransferase [Cyanobacteria bacterium P01_G01_bin.39]